MRHTSFCFVSLLIFLSRSSSLQRYAQYRKVNSDCRSLKSSSKGFGQNKNIDLSSGSISSQKILSIPSLEELSKQSDMTKLNFLRDNLYNKETGKKVFDDTIQFPTEFTLKVIGPNDAKFVDDIVNMAATTLSVSKETIKTATKETMGGKYVSVTLVPYFNSAEELYRCYDVISKDKRVKFCL